MMSNTIKDNPWTLIIKIIILFSTIAKQLIICKALPTVSGPLALVDRAFLKNVGNIENSRVANLTRQHNGDVFTANGMSKCNLDTCVGLSSGTAGLFIPDTKIIVSGKNDEHPDDICNCRCHSHESTYREDLGICVDDIRECTLSPFISGSSAEKIPFVFLPLRGQIIYPSREISFPDIRTPICAVTGSQYLTTTGWSDLRNPIDSDFPFRMFRDEGRTFLQWLGEPDLRYKMQGRLILIHLMCRDMSFPANHSLLNDDSPFNKLAKNIFSPCVAFRINGSPVKYFHNVSEVLFQSENTSNLSATSEGLSTREYIVIGICSLLLGLIYVASVFLYIHVKKRKNLAAEPRTGLDDLDTDINYPKNDQVTFGAPFTRTGSSYSGTSRNDQRNSQRSQSRNLNGGGTNEEIGIVKNNPLLKHFPNLSDHSGFTSDLSNSNSECEETHQSLSDRIKNTQTSVVVHPSAFGKSDVDSNSMLESPPSPTQENECLPEENVSIVEDMGADEKLETMRALVSGTVRKKLYFNPAYFEPQLLMSPPPAAIEFLTKIREVIAIAKYKMATKRYQPSLIMIPEESQISGPDKVNQLNKPNMQANNVRNNKIGQTNSVCANNCPGTITNGLNKCSNCGDKRNSIEKWLETVPIHENNNTTTPRPTVVSNDQKETRKELEKPIEKSPNKQNEPITIKNKVISAPKSKPPPIPTTAPKIISHSLKNNVQSVSPLKYDQIRSPPPKDPPPQVPKEPPISVTRHFDGNSIYKFAETGMGSEIYNNPKFNHLDSPPLSQRSRTSSHRSRGSRKKIEVLDQYANPQRNDRAHYEMLRSMKQMPDMVYEALAKDYSMGMFSTPKSNSLNFNIPTPDYDSTFDKKMKDVYNNTQSSAPSVPTPDYSTLGKKPLRQYQPDSPIYRRKSPQYLIVDYETDSLERTTSNRKCSNSSSPSSNNSSDLSSQPSPSLSTALPMEEEVEIRHTVYDKVEGFRKDGESNIKKKVTRTDEYEDIKEASKKILPPRIIYDTPFRGSMTIEVQHEPLSDLDSTDSDQFEPDTLDRKPKKHSFCDVRNMNAWSEHLKKSKNFVNNIDGKVSYSSLENMTSLPDFSNEIRNQLVLRSSSSFRSNIETNYNNNNYESMRSAASEKDRNVLHARPSFGSLREIYQSKAQRNAQRPKLNSIDFTEKGRLLTLEAKHSKRQRKNLTNDKVQKIMPPDVVPLPSDNNYYDVPKFINDSNIILRKNFKGWNIDDFNRLNKNNNNNNVNVNNNNINNNNNNINSSNINNSSVDDIENTETTSSHSESTEITGVSDTQANSEFEDETPIWKTQEKKIVKQSYDVTSANTDYGTINKTSNECLPAIPANRIDLRGDYSFNKYLSRKKLSEEKFDLTKNTDNKVSPYSTASKDFGQSSIVFPDKTGSNIQTVYRVEVNNQTNGMQIAMGLRDRAKKSKDLKNAWKKFVSLATSKFHPNGFNNKIGHCSKDSEIYEKKLGLGSDVLDEGISSLIDDSIQIIPSDPIQIPGQSGITNSNFILAGRESSQGLRSQSNYYDSRFGQRLEMDSGYMSADSSEMYTRRCYERYNFKLMTEKDHIITVDTIEDNSDGVEDLNSINNQYEAQHRINDLNIMKNGASVVGCNEIDKPIEVNIYSSDEEHSNSRFSFTESDEDGGNTEDMSESGAESVETHSVLFKNIRKNHSNS